jgi:undecaprenyl-diphosphatase
MPVRLPTEWLALRVARLRETRAVLTLSLLLGLFLALSLLANSPQLLEVDRALTRGLQQQRSHGLDVVARVFTFLGNTGTLAAVSLIGALALRLAARPWAALLCAATLLSVPLNMVLKDLVERPRPGSHLVSVLLPAVGLSFPSGHAMGSALVYGFLALMAWVHIRKRPRRLFWTALPIVVALGVSLSRVYLGVHWFSDVLGGWTAGLFLLLLLAETYRVVATAELVPDRTQHPLASSHSCR